MREAKVKLSTTRNNNLKQTIMRSRTAKWMECFITYEKVMENGLEKKVKEVYVVDALSFTEAEARIIDEMKSYISGEFNVQNINPASYGEIFFSENNEADKWYKAKLQFVTIDEKSEKEKKTAVNYLVQASTLEQARKSVDEVMGGTMIDYVIVGVNETKIIDVFEVKEKDS